MAMLEEKAKNDRAVAASESTGVISLISEGEEDHEGSASQSSLKKLKQSSLSLSATGAFSLRGEQKQTKEVPLFVGGEKGRTSTFFHTPTLTDLSVTKKVEAVALVKPAEMEVEADALTEPALLYMSDISAELTMEYVVEGDSVPREPPALVSIEDESKAYGIPKKGSNGTMTVNMWPTPWTPDGWTMNIPNSETIKLGRTDQEIRNCVGKGIGGELLMGFPMPPYDSGNEEIDQSNSNEARRLIGHYRAFHEKCCLSVLLGLNCGKCEEPEERKHGYFESKAIVEGANPDMLFTAVLFDLAHAGTKGKGMGYGAMQNQNASRSLKMAREMTGDKHLIISGDQLGATGGMRHAMNLRFLAWQKFGGRSIPEGELYKLAVDYDKKKGTNTRHSGPAVTNWAKARVARGGATFSQALKEHDEIYETNFSKSGSAVASFLSSISDSSIPGHYHANAAEIDAREGSETNYSKSGSAVQSWARARTGTGEVSHDQALQENDDRCDTLHRFSGPAVTSRIAADVHAGTITSAAEGRRTQDALHNTKFFESTAGVTGGSSAIAALRNTTRTIILNESDQMKGSKVAQSGPGLTIQMSDNFRESNEEEYDIFFFPDRRLSFKEGAKKLDERLTQTSNTNQALKRLIDEIKSGTVNPTATSGSMTFMLLKKGAEAPQMQIVSTAQRLPSTRPGPGDWNALITSSPMPIGYNSDVDGKQDGVKPSKAPSCEPTDIAKTEYAAFKTALAPWYRDDKDLEVDDTVYLLYSKDNLNPIVFHEKTRLESILRLADLGTVNKYLALIEKNDISTVKKASIIIFRC